jgi:hypothetical protein
VPPCWACFKISIRPMKLIEHFFTLASVWAKIPCSRTRRPTIDGCGPDVFRGQQASVSKAKRAITRYTKALSDPVGLAELLVFYCERATGFCQDVDHRDTAYLDALVRTFEQVLKATGNLTGKVQNGFLTRLERVRNIGHNLGYGVGDHMDVLFAELVLPFQGQGRWWKNEETVDTRGHKPSLMQRTRNASFGF